MAEEVVHVGNGVGEVQEAPAALPHREHIVGLMLALDLCFAACVS